MKAATLGHVPFPWKRDSEKSTDFSESQIKNNSSSDDAQSAAEGVFKSSRTEVFPQKNRQKDSFFCLLPV